MTNRAVAVGQEWWLACWVSGVAGIQILSYLLLSLGVPSGFAIGQFTGVAILGVAFVLWLWAPLSLRWDGQPAAFLVVLLLLWVLAIRNSTVTESLFGPLVATLPITVVLLAMKRPDRASVMRALEVFGWVFVGGIVLYLVLELLGLISHRDPGGQPGYELSEYWLPLAGPLGMPGRWAGPSGHPNLISPIGVFLVVFGVTRRWSVRVPFVAVGVLVLLLTGTRSSLAALLAGLLVLVAGRLGWLRGGLVALGWGIVTALAAFAYIGFIAFTQPDMNGRGRMWPHFLSLWMDKPLTGIGDGGIGVAIESGLLPAWAVHGHNVPLDALVRFGVPAAALVVALGMLAIIATYKAAMTGSYIGLAVVMTVIIGGLTEAPLDWRYFGVLLVPLVLSVLLDPIRGTPSEA